MPSRREDKPPSASATNQKKRRRFPRGGPTKVELKKFREALIVLRTEILKSSSKLADEALKRSGQDFSVDHMADHGTDNFEQDFSLSLLEGVWSEGVGVRLLGVGVSHFDNVGEQMDLLAEEEDLAAREQSDALSEGMDAVRERFGSGAITRGVRRNTRPRR